MKIKTSHASDELHKQSKEEEAKTHEFVGKFKAGSGCETLSKDVKNQLMKERYEIEGIASRKSSLRNSTHSRTVIPDSVVTDSSCKDDASSSTLSSNQCLSKNNTHLTRKLKNFTKK